MHYEKHESHTLKILRNTWTNFVQYGPLLKIQLKNTQERIYGVFSLIYIYFLNLLGGGGGPGIEAVRISRLQ